MLLVTVLACAIGASAQQQPLQAPPDLVVTIDGGMVRGTIVESVPNDRVVIVTVTGETRTIPWGLVRYAGLAASYVPPASPSAALATSPPPAATPSVPRPAEAEVRIETEEEGTGVYLQTLAAASHATSGFASARGTARGYDLLCIAPCTTTLRLGRHRIGLELARGSITEFEPVNVTGDGVLRTVIESRSSERLTGSLVGAGLLVGGVIVAALTIQAEGSTELLIGSSVVGVVGAVVLIGFLRLSDATRLEYVPGSAPAAR